MRYKYLPEDFVVQEKLVSSPLPKPDKFRIFLLEKYNQETLKVVEKLARFWRIPMIKIGIAGIKDKYAHTFQYISTPAWVKKTPKWQGINLSPAGFSSHPLSAESLAWNAFTLVVREIKLEEKPTVEHRLSLLKEHGMPNYFDDQRFGSFVDGEWVGKHLFMGNMKRVLYLYCKSHAPEKLVSDILSSWGDWSRCLLLSQKACWHAGERVFRFLSMEGHEKGFRHAVGLLDQRYVLLVANAYRSFLFNQALSLRVKSEKGVFLATRAGEVFVPFEKKDLPREGWIPAYDMPEEDPYLQRVLEEENLLLSDIKIRGIYKTTIHAKKRSLWVYPEIQETLWKEDEYFPQTFKLVISMKLPPGSYATLVLKWLAGSDNSFEKTNGKSL
ncbi:tRNA pseudouridine(13) synthase TruD [Thermospira aquatica]|uniref:tRNA pseudouridine(13) synthase TruD n=1 Tax=Thermospira aquatica TaxID=2828656 RepID=A0AAX3BF81_9SPIR|nr:tRNA pseudouridine(13) synthase TruD [Thermospira aquatica]URA10788.1 tRNA pseudouridine(13) synthase TruD [Thermospira aquatica]